MAPLAAVSVGASMAISAAAATASSSSSFFGAESVRSNLCFIKRSSSGSSSSGGGGGGGGRRSLVVHAKIREIFMPALSSTMTEGKIVSWMKNEGDKLSKGESVVVVESDKADMDVETFYDGYLARIVVEQGGIAPVGAAIALLAETEDEIAEARKKSVGSPPSSTSAPPPPPPVENIVVEVPKSTAAPAAAAAPVPAQVISEIRSGKQVATPHAKQLAKQYKVDISKIVGTGPYGRVVPADVQAFAGKPVNTSGTASALQSPVRTKVVEDAKNTDGAMVAAPVPVTVKEVARVDSVVPFTGMQAAVSKNMVESLSVPTFRVGYTITTTALDALYKKIKSKGVTMSALLAKAVALALTQHPVVNSSCKDGKSFTYNSNINIAVAVAIDGGLITPVLQDADKIDIYSLSRKWKELVDKARAKQLQAQEYTTGTFTISNLGMFGVDRFDAILPPGQGAIMAVGASKAAVVASGGGAFTIKNQMQVNITADHRIIYGADLAAFLQTLSKIIEDPKDLTL